MLMVEHMIRQITDLDQFRSVLRQLSALGSIDPHFDPGLTLAIAYRESGPLILNTSSSRVQTYESGGLDFLGRQLPDLRRRGYIPPGFGARWEALPPGKIRNELGHWVQPALVPKNELIVAYGATIRQARDVFLREAKARHFDLGSLSPRALRAWTMVFFAAPGGRSFGEREGRIGGTTVLTHLQTLIRQGRASDLNDILTNRQLVRYQIVKRGRVSAAEAEMVDKINTMGNNPMHTTNLQITLD
jgi:hypothetical protein